MPVKLYEVGGHIRDTMLGLKSKDIDYAVEAESYEEMRSWIESTHEKIFKEDPQFFTIRAITTGRQVRDYVLCRKEGQYSDGRHPDFVEAGTIYDDLARRDFTMNAIAKDVETGEHLDPFGGINDIRGKRIACVGNTVDRFNEDPLRILRAIRFRITKDMHWSDEIWIEVSKNHIYWINRLNRLPVERIYDEVSKMFKYSTPSSIFFLNTISRDWTQFLFGDKLWLKPTLEER